MSRSDQDTHAGIAAAGWPRALFYLIQFTWGLSVNLAGLFLFLCCGCFPRERFQNSVVTRLPGDRGGLSLGIFIFLSVPDAGDKQRLCTHEYGHTVQCLALGPLYWVIVAIPSVIWYHCFDGWRERRHVPYDALYCERWATMERDIAQKADRTRARPCAMAQVLFADGPAAYLPAQLPVAAAVR